MVKLFDKCPKCGKGTIIADLSSIDYREKEIEVMCNRCKFRTTVPKPE